MGPASSVIFDVVGPISDATSMVGQGGILALTVLSILKAFHIARRMLKFV